MTNLIANHRDISATPTDSMTLKELQKERADLLQTTVDPVLVPVGGYRLVVEKAIQDRIFKINTTIDTQTYQKEN